MTKSRARGVVGGRLTPCSNAGNCVCSEDDGAAEVAPIAFEGDAKKALARMAALIEAEPRTEVVSTSDGYLHATFRSALFGFVDDVEVRVAARESLLHVRSVSRLGRKDFGVNRKRVEALRERFEGRG